MITSLTDFDDSNHRTESATAAFQKGIYHLFLGKLHRDPDVYGQLLRKYQCLFQACLSLLLLDLAGFSLASCVKRIPRRLLNRCADPKRPLRSELDPACLITHSLFEERRWNGFPASHPMARVSQRALDLYGRVVEARHNLLYRPCLLDGPFWEDCTLMGLITGAPSALEIEQVYDEFVSSLFAWREVGGNPRTADYFLQTLFRPYADRSGKLPTETLLLAYARMLNPDNPQFLDELRNYRNELSRVRSDQRYSQITFLQEWRVGEL